MEQVVAVQRHDERARRAGERRPRGQPEVRVDDVEARRARVAAPQRARGARVARAGREREQLDLDAAAPPQRLDLVAHEDAERPGRSGVGYMFVTTSARIRAASLRRLVTDACRSVTRPPADSRPSRQSDEGRRRRWATG